MLSATDPVANEEHIIRINIMLANLFKKRHQYKEAKSLIESAIVLCRKRVAGALVLARCFARLHAAARL